MSESSSPNKPRITIFGAGSIGCYVGGRLAHAGADVTMIGRQRIGGQITPHGLHITDLEGADLRIAPQDFRFSTDNAAAADAELVLVCVKSAATREAGQALATILKPGTVVISLQNGLGNADVLRTELHDCAEVLTGIVEFNVVNRGDGAFHQGSEGSLEAEADPALERFLPLFEQAGLPLALHEQMLPVQWAKLLLNLNNPINALANIPLKEELSQRDFRRCIALAQGEALALLHEADIQPARLTPLPPHWIPKLLQVPNWLFRLLANQMLEIDPVARSSMWEDLEAGRKTEVDWLNGEVLRLAESLGKTAPVNARLMTLIQQAEGGNRHDWSGEQLLAELRDAQRRG